MTRSILRVLAPAMVVLAWGHIAVVARDIDVNSVAEQYVKVVLEIGLYEPTYVDSYYGPDEWKPDLDRAEAEFPAGTLRARVDGLIGQLEKAGRQDLKDIEILRHEFLQAQLRAVQGKIDLLGGAEMSFDEECRILYGAVAPPFDEKYYQGLLDELDELLPGEGDLGSRYDSYGRQFAIPREKFREVLGVAIAQYRKWTVAHLALSADEGFDMEFVYGQPWGAYLTYKGAGRSRLQVNLSGSFTVSDIEVIAGHELYPGHHTHAVLMDRYLLDGRGWVEFSIMPLNSPLALMAEGIAEYGRHDLIGDGADQLAFRREVLFPMVGIDPSEAQRYGRVVTLASEFWGAGVEAARLHLDGTMEPEQITSWIRHYCLGAPGSEYGMIRMIDTFGSYLVNYSLGRTLIRDYMARNGGAGADTARRWELFGRLLSLPQSPSGLKQVPR